MATTVMNKRRFIDWLEKQLTDEQVVLMTQELTGNLTYTKKRNEKKVSFAFAADCFKKAEDVSHIAYGKTPMVAFSVCEKEDVSEDTLKFLEDSLDKKKNG